MTDDLVRILRRLVLSHHRYIPVSGEFGNAPEEYVKMTGRISPEDLEILKKALSSGSQKSDTSSDKESGT